MVDVYFKGWARPGKRPFEDESGPSGTATPDAPPILTTDDDETLDALCGWYKIFQLKKGHRFSTDDLLTAWYGTSWCPSAMNILDLGSGIGTVAMVAAWRLYGASVVTVEAQEHSVTLAKKSVQLNNLANRFDIRMGDFRSPTLLYPNEKFDLVLGSPPYFSPESGVLGDHPQKIACRFEMRGDIFDYCGVAANHLAPGGVFACVFPLNPPHQLQRVIAAAKKASLTIVRYRPVVLKMPDSPLLGLFIMSRSTDLPESFRSQTWIEPSLVIRCQDGTIHPEYSAVKLSFGFPP